MTGNGSHPGEEAAKKGILAGIILVVVETTGGLLSGSLGLLSSAVNTLVDLLAAIINFFAVREAGKPPDDVHMYGHEKIESAAAIGEIALLLAVCAWIVYAAVIRLASGQSVITWLWLAVVVNLVSIGVDSFAYLGMRMSTRTRPSLSMEASALHFLNDLLIAIVVILGLLLYSVGIWWADSVASLAIVAFVLYSGMGLVRESAGVLMDAAPRDKEIVQQLRARILQVEGVEGCHHLRVRKAGQKLFVDAHVEIKGQTSLDSAHSVASAVEERILQAYPSSDILVHTEPHDDESISILGLVRKRASAIPSMKGIHRIVATRAAGGLTLSYHLEFEPTISVESAHELADRLEKALLADIPGVSAIVSHLEPAIPQSLSEEGSSDSAGGGLVGERVARIALGFSQVKSVHEIRVLPVKDRVMVSLHVTVDGTTSLTDAHEVASRMEAIIKEIDPRIEQVVIHSEPHQAGPD